jgi:HAD superfamily hydrolase (TIGR01509 family)
MRPAFRFIQAVAFDMDGLSLNTEDIYGESGSILMSRRGKIFREDVRSRMTGLPAPKAYEVLIQAESLTETWEELHEESKAILGELLPSRVRPMPGLISILDELDRLKIPRCIATSSGHTFARRALELADIHHRMDFVVTAEDVARGKPYPDIYELAASRMGCEPEQMLVLEDSPIGVQAGVSAGCFVVAVPSSHVRDGNFEGSKHIVDRLDADEVFAVLRESKAPTR